MFERISAILHLNIVQLKVGYIGNTFIFIILFAMILGGNSNFQLSALVFLVGVLQGVSSLSAILVLLLIIR